MDAHAATVGTASGAVFAARWTISVQPPPSEVKSHSVKNGSEVPMRIQYNPEPELGRPVASSASQLGAGFDAVPSVGAVHAVPANPRSSAIQSARDGAISLPDMTPRRSECVKALLGWSWR
jgi:hypothetical protein